MLTFTDKGRKPVTQYYLVVKFYLCRSLLGVTQAGRQQQQAPASCYGRTVGRTGPATSMIETVALHLWDRTQKKEEKKKKNISALHRFNIRALKAGVFLSLSLFFPHDCLSVLHSDIGAST